MNRTTELRRSPLRRSTIPLRRTPLSARGNTLSRSVRLRPQSAKRIATNRSRRAAEDALRAERAGCWMCGRVDVETHGHEILGCAQGGDRTKPDAMLCNPCNTWCEDDPVSSVYYGWKRTRKDHPVMPCIAAEVCLPWRHNCGQPYTLPVVRGVRYGAA